MARPRLPCFFALAFCAACGPALGQVYRCGDTAVYTDKPCDGATPIDLRPNLLDAGPRVIPPDPPPAPAIILPSPPAGTAPASASGGSPWDRGEQVWRNRDQREAEHRSRTFRP